MGIKAMSERKESAKRRKGALYQIALCGIMAAFVFLATQLRIPTSIGYMNPGDAVILTASYVLGPFSFFPSAIGSALSDLIAGYPIYIAPTFVIKGLMGVAAGLIMKHPKRDPKLFVRIAGGIVAELIMVCGYYLFEIFVYGTGPALVSVPFNLVQAGSAIVIAVPCSYILKNRRA